MPKKHFDEAHGLQGSENYERLRPRFAPASGSWMSVVARVSWHGSLPNGSAP